jgi:tripartite-type tricarboxylate transporter receptor subunit TctC
VRRRALIAFYACTMALAVACLAARHTGALAQDRYPNRPVRLVVGVAPGSTADVSLRILAQKLSQILDAQFVVENRTGAGTTIAAQFVAQSAKDGYTLMYGGSANTVNASLSPNPSFDLTRDLDPIVRIAAVPNILVVHPSLGVKSAQELIALAKSKPGEIFFASSGVGTSPHLSAELFNLMAGVKMSHVPYQGSSQGINDVLAGRVPVMFTPASTALPHVRSGALIALGSTHANRTKILPDLPTIAEAGLPGFETGVWNGLLAPAGTPGPVVERLTRVANEAIKSEDVVKALEAQGIIPLGGTPDEMAKFIRSEIDKWARVVDAAGLRK